MPFFASATVSPDHQAKSRGVACLRGDTLVIKIEEILISKNAKLFFQHLAPLRTDTL